WQKISTPTFLLCPLGFTSAKRGDQRDDRELGITLAMNSFSSSGPRKMLVCNTEWISTLVRYTGGGTGRLRWAYMPAISGVTSWIVISFSDMKEKLNGVS